MSIPAQHRNLYYQWLEEQHGFGEADPRERDTGDQPPFLWFKFQDPRTNKGRLSPVFLKGWSFPYPCGGAWDALVRPNVPISTDQENYLRADQALEAANARRRRPDPELVSLSIGCTRRHGQSYHRCLPGIQHGGIEYYIYDKEHEQARARLPDAIASNHIDE